MKATRRTVLGWMLAALLVRPTFDNVVRFDLAPSDDWSSITLRIPRIVTKDGGPMKAVYFAEDEHIRISMEFDAGVTFEDVEAEMNRSGVIRVKGVAK